MLQTIIKPNTYQDSVSLMMLSTQLSGLDAVERVSIMMGTPANKEIFRDTGFGSDELEGAGPSDLVIALEADGAGAADLISGRVAEFLKSQASAASATTYPRVRSLDRALTALPDANLALVSIPGEQAAPEIDRLLDKDLHVFVFSDNLAVDDEVRLKHKARERGLLMMGPDCGTGSLGGLPLAFTNIVTPGSIGIVGASGTGTQEVMVQIDRAGGGVSQAIGLGGRDLSEKVGAVTCLQALRALDADPGTSVITLVSKPPAPSVRETVLDVCQELATPVVAILLGEQPAVEVDGNVHFAATLDEAARLAVSLAGTVTDEEAPAVELAPGQRTITGLFCGGTLTSEAAILLSRGLGVPTDAEHADGYMLHHDGHTVIDLGDDAYTQGRPHPMIDPSLRAQMIRDAFDDRQLAVLLLDVVTGFGSHEDPAGAIVGAIEAGREAARADGREVVVVASVCGTEKDPQPLSEQTRTLQEAGVVVLGSNAAATRYALGVVSRTGERRTPAEIPEPTRRLVSEAPRVVNVGLASFADTLQERGGQVVQYTWSPLAGGNARLQRILAALS
ncbi:FdrA family protein [Beutenbergia cavernae DSM 12333]|uniref:FdrA family protein n=1 Tax=Beutenbergia cavernae (strain ATCC BAA-8 / DSM 12333 / CCUG 43141 / JCM 11478 / NBRC 16432 / NCIMB 13614 / HKI 0122) TaxID=471853 RepID=C5BXU8_BEUC1|nr:acyl-CoA synthetase FdrA [Beutenbergia cavernae]ACQ78842.1 FdrA family protein [Beutenbergia cavernae DSM 12333]